MSTQNPLNRGPFARPDDPKHKNSAAVDNDGKGLETTSRVSGVPGKEKGGGGGHSSIAPNFDMNPATGTMSLSLPIYTSPGRSGFGPSLALSYDSGSGNGPFGVGWQLSISSVTRQTSRGVPEYTSSDAFLLSGHDELVAELDDFDPKKSKERISGTFSVKIYRPRVETEVIRIEHWEDMSNPQNVFWKTITGANVTTFYGESDESRIFDFTPSGQRRIFSWLACRSYDASGNAIQFDYKAENSQGIDDLDEKLALNEIGRGGEAHERGRYLKRIKYGNRSPNRDLESWEPKSHIEDREWLFEVVFDYGDHGEVPIPQEIQNWPLRSHPYTTCRSGFEVRNYRLCQRVLMFHRFPEKIGREFCLVSSASFKYTEDGGMEQLAEFLVQGYLPSEQNGGYIVDSLPPISFQYTQALSPRKLSMQISTGENMHHFNYNTGDIKWVDLFGDGAPGLLHAPPHGPWTYQRNQAMMEASDKNFGSPTILHMNPSSGPDGALISLEDIDHDGNIDAVFFDTLGRPLGYNEYEVDHKWKKFKYFENVPSFDTTSTECNRVDLTGDGLADIIRKSETGEVFWHKNLAKAGFSSGNRMPDTDSKAHLYLGGTSSYTTFADMTGDGLADLLEIKNGVVTYWPNYGNGHFGPALIMNNPPMLAPHQTFNTKRIQLADIDGSGTTDLLYFPESGGVHVFYNLAGNSWSSRVRVSAFPVVDDLSSVFTMDLLGNGTTCLCWLGVNASTNERNTLYYIDLVGPEKPYLLKSFSTGMGATTTITYKPSTWYSLTDEQAGTPWRTKLPFPVHCVAGVLVEDAIARTSKRSRYAYHDGYYDGFEREFRGFSIVEAWDEEEFTLSDRYLRRPPIRTKTWYHIGTTNFGKEGYGELDVSQNSFPSSNGKSDEYIQEVNRSLKGAIAREELYSDDGSTLASIPYFVKAYSYQVREVRPKSTNKWSVFRVIAQESFNCHYERRDSNPKISREIILDADDFGNPLKSIVVARGIDKSELKTAQDRAIQQRTWATYTENTYAIVPPGDDYLYAPQIASTTTYSISGFDETVLNDRASLAADDWAFFSNIKEVPIHSTKNEPGFLGRSLVGASRTYYFDKSITKRLDLGEIEEFSPVYKSYQLTFTSEILSRMYSSENLLKHQSLDDLLSQGAYVKLDPDGPEGHWWTPSSQQYLETSSDNLAKARGSFYIPSTSIDPFGNITLTEIDEYCLLATKVVDPIGNEILTEYDYVQLQPSIVIDPNGNRTGSSYDCFGTAVGTATMGKSDDIIGDSLEDFEVHIDKDRLQSFILDPSEQACRELLGKARSRTVQYLTRFGDADTAKEDTPAFVAEITSDVFGSERGRTTSMTMVAITYLDGVGNPLQTIALETPASETSAARWSVSGWIIKDSKGNAVRECHSQFSDTHTFQHGLNSQLTKSTYLLDPLDRVIGTLNADHTWSKTKQLPWMNEDYNAGMTVDIAEPSKDEDVGQFFSCIHESDYLPTWNQMQIASSNPTNPWPKEAAEKSLHYKTHPPRSHIDARGLVFLTEKSPSIGVVLEARAQYNMAGNITHQWDELGRLVSVTSYDMLGRVGNVKTMDAGEMATFYDCAGLEKATWNSRDISLRRDYDALGRETQLTMTNSTIYPNEVLLHDISYGEAIENASLRNLRARAHIIRDQSGIRENERFDFFGNCLKDSFQIAKNYKTTNDWNHPVEVEGDKFHTERRFDALNRLIEAKNANDEKTTNRYHYHGGIRSSNAIKETKEGDSLVSVIKDTRYSHDQQLEEAIFGNGTILQNYYDEKTRILIRKTLRTESGETLQDLHFHYDCLHRVSRKVDKAQETQYFRNNRVDAAWDYTYNGIGQLIQSTGRTQVDSTGDAGSRIVPYTGSSASNRSKSSGNGKQVCEYLETYIYDDAGNLTKMQQEPTDTTGISGWSRSFEYSHPSMLRESDTGNRLSQTRVGDILENYSSNEAGCITAMSGYSSLQWDHNNKLQSSSVQVINDDSMVPETTYFVYSSDGRRIRKVTERFGQQQADGIRLKDTIYLPSTKIFRKFAGDGITIKTETFTTEIITVSGSVDCFIERDSVGSDPIVRFTPNDNLELDLQGRVISYEEFSAFGSIVYVASKSDVDISKRYRYASYERDSETGLHFMNARYYAPWIGRWMSPDPLLFVDGLNLYAYVGNDPVNHDDPSGTCKKNAEKTKRADSEDEKDTKKPKLADNKALMSQGNYTASTASTTTTTTTTTTTSSSSSFSINSLLNPPTSSSSYTAYQQPQPLLQLKLFPFEKMILDNIHNRDNLDPVEDTGDRHHLYMDHYTEAFLAAGIDPEKTKLWVEGPINKKAFAKSHDNMWEKFFTRYREYNNVKTRKIHEGLSETQRTWAKQRNMRDLVTSIDFLSPQSKAALRSLMHRQVLINLSNDGLLWKDAKRFIVGDESNQALTAAGRTFLSLDAFNAIKTVRRLSITPEKIRENSIAGLDTLKARGNINSPNLFYFHQNG